MVQPPRCWGGGMPGAGQVKPPVVERLSDRIAIGVLTSTFPPGLVDQVVAGGGRREERQRLLPARVVVWLVLAMALFSGQAYEEVARLLAGGLGWAGRWRQWWRVPSTPAIAKARARLGPEPLALLFGRSAGPLATEETRGAWYRGLRVLSLDGTTLEVPDTFANAAAFGRPAQQPRRAGRLPPGAPAGGGRVRHPRDHPGDHWPVHQRGGHPGPRSSACSARECCCWPTAALPALGCGGRRPRPARRW